MFSDLLTTICIRTKFFFCAMIILRLLSNQSIRAAVVQPTVVGLSFVLWAIRSGWRTMMWSLMFVKPGSCQDTSLYCVCMFTFWPYFHFPFSKKKTPKHFRPTFMGHQFIFLWYKKKLSNSDRTGGITLLISGNLGRLDELYLFKSGFFTAFTVSTPYKSTFSGDYYEGVTTIN